MAMEMEGRGGGGGWCQHFNDPLCPYSLATPLGSKVVYLLESSDVERMIFVPHHNEKKIYLQLCCYNPC